MPMLAELVDAVVGVDTHRDSQEVEIALPTGIAIGTLKISNDDSGFAAQLPRQDVSEMETLDLARLG